MKSREGHARDGGPDIPPLRSAFAKGAARGMSKSARSAPSRSSRASDAVDFVFETVAPTRCVVCERPGALLCGACAMKLRAIDQQSACPVCGAPFGIVSCTECLRPEGPLAHSFDRARACYVFDDASARLVRAFKDEGERRLASLIAERIMEAAGDFALAADVIVPIAPTRAALRKRGFDHMGLVAKECERLTGLPVYPCLEKAHSRDQRALSREERMANMREAFSIRSPQDAAGIRAMHPRILLVDDVFTTGATLDAAAATLRGAGACAVDAAALCRVWGSESMGVR